MCCSYRCRAVMITNSLSNKNISKYMSIDDSEFWSDLLIKIVKTFGMKFKSSNLPLDILINRYEAIHYLLFFIIVRIMILMFLLKISIYIHIKIIFLIILRIVM